MSRYESYSNITFHLKVFDYQTGITAKFTEHSKNEFNGIGRRNQEILLFRKPTFKE